MNEIKNNVKDVRKYYEYIDLGKESRQLFLMFAELIDNSIGSFEKEFGNRKWEKPLKVEIEINHRKNLNSIREINLRKKTIEYNDDSYIKVSDNAFGIEEEKMPLILKLNEINLNSNSKMNEHGRGLKQSAFFLGLGVDVLTKGKDGSFAISNRPLDSGLDNEVVFTYEKANKLDYGTEITISPLRIKRRINKKKLKQIQTSLAERYGNLIEANQLKLKIRYLIENDKEYIITENFEKIKTIAKLWEDCDWTPNDRNKKWEDANKKFDKKISESNENDEFVDFVELRKNVVQELRKIFLNENREIEIKWKNVLKLNEDINIPVTFWSNSRKRITNQTKERTYRTFIGLTVYQANRAILHPPNSKESSTYHEFMSGGKISGDADYKFAGSFSIDNTNITTTVDKSNIEFNEPDEKNNFDKQLKLVYKTFIHFYESMKSSSRSEGGVEVDNEDKRNAKSNLENKFSKENAKIEINWDDIDNDISYFFHKKQNGVSKIYKIQINLNSRSFNINETSKVITTIFKDGDSKNFDVLIKATLFTAHPIWKKFDQKKNYFSNVMIIIAHLLIAQEIKGREFTAKINNVTDSTVISPLSWFNEVSDDCD